ncbi:MAG: DUF5009 domain-containing protein [Acidobacteriaceae bacterium]|nr:DUF5009 domain-containing protein [Acidobacteriaceae bacterium]
MASRAGIEPAVESFPPHASPVFGERLVSLDAFRGLTMLLMVIVNSSGPAVYYQLRHAEWNGWTLADTVYPSFLWIVGVAITLALGKRLSQGIPRSRLVAQIFRRSAVIYALGLFIYLFPNFDFVTMRIPGVLQRIAICYCIAALLYLYSDVRGQIMWVIGLLAAYWLAMKLIPAPGFAAGDLTLQGNLAHYVDHLVYGRHNWSQTKTWDPEGVLSTAPAIATTLLGVLSGYVLQLRRPLAERCVWLLIGGICLLFAGLICSIWLPINKNLWTSSFALFMAGLDGLVFSGFLWLIDGCGYRRAVQPLVILGMNAIAVYLFSEILPETILFVHSHVSGPGESLETSLFSTRFFPPSLLALLYALVFAAFMYGFAWALYRKRWFLRV